MALPVKFDGHDGVLGAPSGSEGDIIPLPVFRTGYGCVSCWQLSKEEAEEVARTGQVWIYVVSGGDTQPPIAVSGTVLVTTRRHS